MKNIANKVSHEKEQGDVDQKRKCEILTLENPTDRSPSKTKLPSVLGNVTRVMLILLPKFSTCHRVFLSSRPGLLVPGLFVGTVPGGGSFLGLGVLAGRLGCGVGRSNGREGCGFGLGSGGCGIKVNVAKSSNDKLSHTAPTTTP